MSAAKKIIDKKILRELLPLNTLSQSRFNEISEKISITEILAGRYLFRSGERDNRVVYLLGGEISLLDEDLGLAGTIIGGSEASLSPIANSQPRALTARAAKKCIVARIDASLLDAFLSWDQSNDAEAVSIGAVDNDDWMTRMLQSQAFEKIPPSKIQKLLLKMDAIELETGATVIRQGDAGDYFYTIQSGSCAVTRRKTPQAKEQQLAVLSSGDCFGEEALVSDETRNATVTMLTDGVLMRLARKDFNELLKNPLIRFIEYDKAAEMVEAGAVWLDVRNSQDYELKALRDSVNIPLDTIRGEIPELIFNASYILCCQSGKQSETAAFILSHKGFDVSVLEGGLQAVPDAVLDYPETESTPPPPGRKNKSKGQAREERPPGSPTACLSQLEQQVDSLHGEKQRLESVIAMEHKKLTSTESLVEEQKKLREQDKLLLAKTRDELGREIATLHDQIQRLENLLGEQAAQSEKFDSEMQAAESDLDSKSREWKSERSNLESELEHARLLVVDLRKQLDQGDESHAAKLSAMEQKLEEQDSAASKKLEEMKIQCAELSQAHSGLQGEVDDLTTERKALQENLEAVSADVCGHQEEISRLTAQLAESEGKAEEQAQALIGQREGLQEKLEAVSADATDRQQEIARLKEQIAEAAGRAVEETRAHISQREDLQARLEEVSADAVARQEEIESLMEQHAEAVGKASEEARALGIRLEEMELKREEADQLATDSLAQVESMQEKFEAMRGERDGLEQKAVAMDAETASLNQELESLQARLEEHKDSASEKLETMQRDREDLQQQMLERDAHTAAMQKEIDALKSAAVNYEKEILLLGQSREELENALQQQDAGDDGTSRNDEPSRDQDNVRELQAQLERLRKKLEQTTSELREVREAEQSDVDGLREQLRGERSARAEERSEMAARQRELKEQLAAVASEHEAKIAGHSGAIEDARNQQMQETRQESESRLEALQVELQQAHEEIARLLQAGNPLDAAEQDPTGERQQHESTVEKLKAQVITLMQERDAAGSADASATLRAELEQARKRIAATERLHAETEAACGRIKDEKEALEKQIGNNISLGIPLNQSSPIKSSSNDGRAEYAALPTTNSPSALTEWRARVAVTGQKLRSVPAPVSGDQSRNLLAYGLATLVLVGLLVGVNRIVELLEMPHVQAEQVNQADGVGGQQDDVATELSGPARAVAAQRPVTNPGAVAAVPQVVASAQVRTDGLPPVQPHQAATSDQLLQRLQAAGTFQDSLDGGGVAPLMVRLPAATFMMGSRGNSLNADEGPQHEVSLHRFAISRYEVTFDEYDHFARASGRRLPHDRTWGRGTRPAIKVSWKEAQAYVEWLSAKTGQLYSLPSEAQWEFAARAGSMSVFPWESAQKQVPANCFDCGSEWDQAMTAPVGSFAANYFGLFDMGGNVEEWTEDCYRDSYAEAPADGSPVLVDGCTQRVVRGGAFSTPLQHLRTNRRGQYDHDTRLDTLGFRVVRSFW